MFESIYRFFDWLFVGEVTITVLYEDIDIGPYLDSFEGLED